MSIPTFPTPLTINAKLPTPNKYIITSTSPTAITNLSGPTVLYGIYVTASGLTVYLRLFDEGPGPTGAQADCVFGDGTSGSPLTVGSPVLFNAGLRLYNGLSYSLSGTMNITTANIVLIVA